MMFRSLQTGLRTSVLVTSMVSVVACAGGTAPTPTPTTPLPAQVITVEGFPLDRTLEGLRDFPRLDYVAVVSGLQLGEARWTTPDGTQPPYITEKRAPTEPEAQAGWTIVTPVTATVKRALSGPMGKGDSATFIIVGGTVGSVRLDASAEIAPALAGLTPSSQVLVAGPIVNSELGIAFAYTVDGAGRVASLMDSAGKVTRPTFDLSDLERLLTTH